MFGVSLAGLKIRVSCDNEKRITFLNASNLAGKNKQGERNVEVAEGAGQAHGGQFLLQQVHHGCHNDKHDEHGHRVPQSGDVCINFQ